MRYQRLFPLAPAVLALVTSSCGGRMGGPLNRIDRVAALPLQVAGRRLAVRLEGWVTLADAAAAPSLFYADWVHPIGEDRAVLKAYRARLLARPSFARCIDEARPYRGLFPLGAPDRD